MTYSLESNETYHTIRVTLNSWYIDWIYYGEDIHEVIIEQLLDKSLSEYIDFCFKPEDSYYHSFRHTILGGTYNDNFHNF
jgi:hypothetical protein